MDRRREAPLPAALVGRLLRTAGDEAVLVGGQALAFWADRYGLRLPDGVSTVSNDADFLAHAPTSVDLVHRMAQAMHGQAEIARPRALTALIGQAIRPLADGEILNVDVIRSVIGLQHDVVRRQAVRVTEADGTAYLVMHPLHVLRSRLINLHKLPEKQDDKGRMQLALAIDMAREHLRAVAAQSPRAALASGRSPIQPLVGEIERMARSDAGRKIAKRWSLHVADAIDPTPIPAGPFWQRRWPALSRLMSPAYASAVRMPR
jgi:hypothetical protein